MACCTHQFSVMALAVVLISSCYGEDHDGRAGASSTVGAKVRTENSGRRASSESKDLDAQIDREIRVQVVRLRNNLGDYLKLADDVDDNNTRIAADVLTLSPQQLYDFYTSDDFDEIFYYMAVSQELSDYDGEQPLSDDQVAQIDPYRHLYRDTSAGLGLVTDGVVEGVIEDGFEQITGERDKTGGIVLIATGGIALGMGGYRVLTGASTTSKAIGGANLGIGLGLLYVGQRLYGGEDSIENRETGAYLQLASGIVSALGAGYLAYEGVQYLTGKKELKFKKSTNIDIHGNILPDKKTSGVKKVLGTVGTAGATIIPFGRDKIGSSVARSTGLSNKTANKVFGGGLLGVGAPLLMAGAMFSVYSAEKKISAIKAEKKQAGLDLAGDIDPRVKALRTAENAVRKIVFLKRMLIAREKRKVLSDDP